MKNTIQLSFNFIQSLFMFNNRVKQYLFIVILMLFMGIGDAEAQCYSAPSYCNPTAVNVSGYGMGMTNVTMNTAAMPIQINNTTTANTVGIPFYFNYSNLVVQAAAGVTVNFSITNNTSYASTFRIYIDYNVDGTFATTAPELVYTSALGVATSSVTTGTFTVPTGTPAGVYRIRVASDYSTNIPLPCGPLQYSAEIEDYTLLVPSATSDVLASSFTAPGGFIVGNNTIGFSFSNISSVVLTSASIGYQLDANTPVIQTLSGLSVNAGTTYSTNFTTQLNIPATGVYLLKAWVTNPNGSGSVTPANDTICRTVVTYCSGPLNGTYTINPSGSGTSNFVSFGAADSAMINCGISGPVVFNVAAGTYTERLIFPNITGVSATNTITFNGNGSTLQYNCDAINYSVIRFQAARYFKINDLIIKPLNATYAWGVHFYQNADYNTLNGCTIDFALVTGTATSTAGIVFSNSLTSPTTSGANGKYDTIMNCYIKGHPSSGGPYYGVALLPQTSTATISGNNFINNIIENVYVYGFYMTYTNGTMIKNNIFRNPTRTTVNTVYNLYIVNGSTRDTIYGNTFTSPYGGATTTANTYYGVYAASTNTPAGSELIFANNRFYNIQSNGSIYGLYLTSSTNVKAFHNTFCFDHAASTVTSAYQSIAIFHNGTLSGNGLDFRNNIFHITRGGASMKYAVNLSVAGVLYNFNNNIYYVTGINSYTGYYLSNFQTFLDWRTANGGLFDAGSINISPNFINTASGNLTPQEGFINNKGTNLISVVPADILGASRTTTPDPGAYEFVPTITIDAGVNAIVLPSSPLPAGSIPINVTIRNSGLTALTSATINWTYNGIAQTPYAWTGSLGGGFASANILLGSVTVISAIPVNITAWTSNPNSSTDLNFGNDTAYVFNAFCALSAGTYTINAGAAATSTNFQSFTVMQNALNRGGIAGPVTINVVSGSGPYTEQIRLNGVAGSSVANKITINGNNQVLQYNNTDAGNLHILALNGTDNLILDGLTIRSLNASYGIGIILTNNADSNIIRNCDIDISSVTGGSSSGGICFTGAFSSPTTTPTNWTGYANIIQNNLIRGGSAGGPYYGITLIGTNSSNPAYSNNKILNNVIRDFTVYGLYQSYTAKTTVKGNEFLRPTKSSPTTFYGIYLVNGSQADTIESNLIYKPFEALQTYTGTFYGIYCATINNQATTPTLIKNNIIHDIKSSGPVYGIYSSSNAYLKLYNNTINIDHAASTSTGVTYAIYSTSTATAVNIRNNIINIYRGGTGAMYCLYLNTAGTYTCNYNSLRCVSPTGGTNANYGYYPSTSYQTFATWKTANTNAYDQNSVSANPNFRTYIGANFLQPSNDSLNNRGISISTDVPKDFTGATRSATPDPGAYEFSVPAADVGMIRITSPINPISLGTQNVISTIKNFGTAAIYMSDIGWSVNNVAQPTYAWSGLMNQGDTSSSIIGSYSFATSGIYNLKVWSALPNTVVDSFALNDTVSISLCTPLSGTLTVNPALASSSTNYTSFSALFQVLQTCGISGPVTVNIAPGIYSNQVTVPSYIPGLTSVSQLTFDGGDSSICRITHDGSIQRATLLLNGARNCNFRNITFDATSTTSAAAVQLINAADSNTFVKCTFRVPIISSSVVNPFVASGSLTSATTAGNSANYLLIDSCKAVGGYYGIVLYGNSVAPKGTSNIIRNSVSGNSYYCGMYNVYQNGLTITNNNINSIGINAGYTSPYCIYMTNSDNANTITKNNISNTLGGYGIYASTNIGNSAAKQIIANNMIQIGAAANVTYGIYEVNNAYLDVAFNTVKLLTADASNAGGAMVTNNTVPATYNNIRIINNIFVSPAGAQAIYVVTQTNVGTALYTIDNNVYYSSGTYPFRVAGFVTTGLTNFATSANMLGTVLPGNNAMSQYFLPNFFSSTNLRSISPQLDAAAISVAGVTDDIDGNLRSATPDIGVYEFTKPANDAGAVAILTPVQPVVPGLSDIVVLIRNYGSTTLYSSEVTYQVDTTIRTQTYIGTILPGAYDTVKFTSSSGPSSSSQQYNFPGGLKTIRAWTSSPNFVVDSLNLNDTTQSTVCGGLSGNYTIDPAGSGSSNFTSFQAAIDKMVCGGVYGPVTFNIASGTYNGQIVIPTIIGAGVTNNITFKSATSNAANVIITSNNATGTANYTINTIGAQYLTFRYLTLQNTSGSYSRVVSLNKNTTSNVNSSDIEFRDCIFNGITVSSTSDVYAIVFAPTNESPGNLRFIGNTFNNGSIGISVSGPNVVNQNTIGLVADTSIFNNQYYAALWLTNRFSNFVRGNTINISPLYTSSYGIYMSSVGQQSEVLNNLIQNPSGVYGIYVNQQAYYAAAGILTIANNVINMQSASATEYGIYITNSSMINLFNNTINILTNSTASYAVYISGNASFLSGSVTYPASNSIQLKNNLLKALNGYALYSANTYSNAALTQNDNNLYYSGSATTLNYLNGTTYTVANFNAFKNALYAGSDMSSVSVPITFTSTVNFLPNIADTNSWALNGRGTQIYNISKDIAGNFRSNDVVTGAPDIGAYEFTPSVIAPKATVNVAPANSVTQVFTSFLDTIATITWGSIGTVPSSFDLRYNSGTNPPGSSGYNVTNCYWHFNPIGGSSYYYDMTLRYKPAMLGTVPSESELILASKDSLTGPWSPNYSTSLDTINRLMGTTFLLNGGYFAGTYNLAPLPVKLNSFTATRTGNDVVLDWQTASELNSEVFGIERSFNGAEFESIGKVKAAGNSNSSLQYYYTDYKPVASNKYKAIYYRLKMVDKDGKFEYSQVRKVLFDESIAHTTVVYPNPFSSDVNISINAVSEGNAGIRVFDIFGRLVATQTKVVSKGNNTFVMDKLNQLQQGVYVLKININGVETTDKVIKE